MTQKDTTSDVIGDWQKDLDSNFMEMHSTAHSNHTVKRSNAVTSHH